MNKQEIEKALDNLKENVEKCKEYGEISQRRNSSWVKTQELAISALAQLLNNGWIPVTERFPEIKQMYDISIKYENFSGVYEITRMAEYIGDGEWNIYGPQPVVVNKSIIAWRERPESYTEVSE